MKATSLKIYLLLFLVIIAQLVQAQVNSNEQYNRGIELYSAARYQEAADIWTELYNKGNRSASLNYNIANAYFKLQNIPAAILYYERAYLLDPTDEDINYNLQIARTMIVDRFREIPELFFVNWYNLVSLLVSSDTWALLSIITFIFCLFSVSLYIYSTRYLIKVIGFWFALSLLVVSSSALTFSIRNRNLVHENHEAIVFSPVVSGKSSPDASGTDLFVLHEGTKVAVEDEVGDWFEIRLSDGNKGWIPSNSVERI